MNNNFNNAWAIWTDSIWLIYKYMFIVYHNVGMYKAIHIQSDIKDKLSPRLPTIFKLKCPFGR